MRIREDQWDEIGELAEKISSRSVETSKSSVLKTALEHGIRTLNEKIQRSDRRRQRVG